MSKTFRLFLVLIILLVVALIYKLPINKWYSDIFSSDNFLSEVDINQINKIEIKQDNKVTVLLKQDKAVNGDIITKWKIDNTKDFYADQIRVKELLNKLTQIKENNFDLVSKDKDRQSEFGLDKETIELKVYFDDDLLSSFFVGKISSDYSSNYLSLTDSEKVCSVKVLLKNIFARTDWRDLMIFSFDQDKINKIRFQYPNREFTIEKQNEIWTGVLPYDFTVSEEKIRETTNMISSLYSIMIPEQDFEKTGLEKHLIIIEVSGDDFSNTIMIGNKNDSGFYYAKRADSDNIYLITEEQKNILDKQIWQLR